MLFLAITTQSAVCKSELILEIVQITVLIFDLIKWIAPTLLVIFGGIDMAKAIVAGEEKEIKTAQKLLAKRAGAAVLVFFLVSIVSFLVNLFNFDNYCGGIIPSAPETEEKADE